jgi:hypothetical protein
MRFSKNILHLDNQQAMVNRIVDLYNRTPQDTRESAIDWYREAHEEAQMLASKHNVSLDVAVGVVAVLSPRLKWDLNIEYADQILGHNTVSDSLDATMRCFKTSRIKAWDVKVQGSVDGILRYKSAPKTYSFHQNILHPDSSDYVTIDTWAVIIASPILCNNNDLAVTGKTYTKIADAYREAARIVGILPSELQAITWVQYRIENVLDAKEQADTNLIEAFHTLDARCDRLWQEFEESEGKATAKILKIAETESDKFADVLQRCEALDLLPE